MKKGLLNVLPVVLVIVLFIIGVLAVTSIFDNAFRLSTVSQKSFLNLAKTINEFDKQPVGAKAGFNLRMDKETGIVYMKPNVTQLRAWHFQQSLVATASQSNGAALLRPTNCPSDEPCFFLCKGFTRTDNVVLPDNPRFGGATIPLRLNIYECSTAVKIDNFDTPLVGLVEFSPRRSGQTCAKSRNLNYADPTCYLEGEGFWMDRGFFSNIANGALYTSRIRGLALEKTGEGVTICYEHPCSQISYPQ